MTDSSSTATSVIIPPVEQCVRQLHDLERWFGTEPLAEALERYRYDADFRARYHGADPDRLIRDLQLGEPEPYVADLIAQVHALPVATPFPARIGGAA